MGSRVDPVRRKREKTKRAKNLGAWREAKALEGQKPAIEKKAAAKPATEKKPAAKPAAEKAPAAKKPAEKPATEKKSAK